MDVTETTALLAFVPFEEDFKYKLKLLEPSGFDNFSGSPVFKDSYSNHMFHAENVCVAMKGGK